MTKYLVRYYWNKMLEIQRCFIHTKKDKHNIEDFEKLNFKAKSQL